MSIDRKLIKERDRKHYEQALKAWESLHKLLQDVNIEHVLFGSLKNGDFKSHSDIDVMIFGDLSAQEMTIAERAISAVYQEFGVKIDYLYAMYYTEKNLHEILE